MKSRLAESSVLVASGDQISADVSSDQSGDVVILHLKDGIYYELNETSAFIWNMIQRPCRFRDILNSLLAYYDVDTKQCEADLVDIAQEMIEHGLVEIRDETNP